MIAVVGNPRSGTSMTCHVHLRIFGEDRLIGSKFMGSDKVLQPQSQKSEIIEYAISKIKDKASNEKIEEIKNKRLDQQAKRFEHMKDMNKDGFYECPFTVQGMKWTPQTDELWKKIRTMKDEPFCKLVCSGIAQTDPTLISRIVYINRHPREVAKSQEKLVGGVTDMLPEGEVIHSPDFFIKSTSSFCAWYTSFGYHIPLFIVDYADMLSKPEETVKRIARFHGMPHHNAWEIIKQDSYRSKPQDVESPQWEDAEAIYEMMNKKDFVGVVDYMNNQKIMTHKVNRNFLCHRTGRMTNLAACKNCVEKDDVKANYILQAEKDGIDWAKEPCALECGIIDDEGAITIKESIEKHSWLKESAKIGDSIEKFIKMLGIAKVFGTCNGCEQRKQKLNRMFMKDKIWGDNTKKDDKIS